MTKRVLIIGYYGYGNVGDEAILQCIIRDLYEEMPDLEITVVSGNPIATKSTQGINAISVREFTKVIHAAQSTDLIILGGGGLFHDYDDFDPGTLLTRKYWGIAWYSTYPFLATLLDKPFMLYAVGVGPLFSEHAKIYTLAAFEQAAAITVRDDGSRNLLIKLGAIPERIQTVSDPVLGMPFPSKADTVKRLARQQFVLPSGKPIIAVSLRHWQYGPMPEADWLSQIAQALDTFIETYDAAALFIPFQKISDLPININDAFNDASVVALLTSAMRHGAHLTTLSGIYSVNDVAGIIGCCDLMLGMRLHSLILAANAGIPVVGIIYDPKVRELMQQLGLEAFSTDLADINGAALYRMLDAAYNNRAEITENQRVVSNGRQSAKIAASLLREGAHPLALSDTTLGLLKRALLTLTLNFDAGDEQMRANQVQREALYNQYVSLKSEYDAIEREHQQGKELVNRMLATRVWKLATFYWQTRDNLRRIAKRLFNPVHRAARWLYRLLLPLRARLALRQVRWRIKGYKPATSPEKVNQTAQPGRDSPSIVIFATVPYHDVGGGQRSAQLTKTFGKLGYRLLYIYVNYSSDGSEVQSTSIPASLHTHLSAMSPQKLLPHLGATSMFIFEAPHPAFEAYLTLAEQTRIPIVYEHIDNWDSRLGHDLFFDFSTLRTFMRRATLLVATSQKLVEQLEKTAADDLEFDKHSKPISYIPNAVDVDIFDLTYNQTRPSDIVAGLPTILYYGSLWGEWFCWLFVEEIARKIPQASINLIGDYAGIPERVRTMPPNVHFLGLKRQTELPAYLAHSDFAIIPFLMDDFSSYISPLKVFEYIAMGKPVLSTHLPDIEGYPGVFATNQAAEWVDFAAGGYKTRFDATQRIREQEAFTLQNSWYARSNRLLAELRSRVHALTVSIVVLNHNNKDVIFKCVNSLLQFNAPYNYEVIVVDNLSSDGSYELLEQDTRIKLIRNSVNGCASGRNLGVQHSSGEVIVFVDSDQWVVSEGWLDVGLSILDKHRNIGAVGRNAGWFERGQVTGRISLYLPNEGMLADQLFRMDVAFLATSGMIMRRALFNALGGFDTAYDPTCYEDTDLSLKIRDAGFELAYTSRLPINHLPHQTTQSGSAAHTELMQRNGAYFRQKWSAKNAALLEYYVS